MVRNSIIGGFVGFAAIAAATGHLLLVGYVVAVAAITMVVGLMAWGVVGALSWRVNFRRRVAARPSTAGAAMDGGSTSPPPADEKVEPRRAA